MNPRVLELATKAGLYVDVNGQPWPRNMNGEDIEGAYARFAELIVSECAEISGGSLGPTDRYHTALRIKEHFRVDKELRPWIPLTEEEIGGLYRAGWSNNMDFARAIEAKLKEKNNLSF